MTFGCGIEENREDDESGKTRRGKEWVSLKRQRGLEDRQLVSKRSDRRLTNGMRETQAREALDLRGLCINSIPENNWIKTICCTVWDLLPPPPCLISTTTLHYLYNLVGWRMCQCVLEWEMVSSTTSSDMQAESLSKNHVMSERIITNDKRTKSVKRRLTCFTK